MISLSTSITSLTPSTHATYILYCFSYAGGSGQNFHTWRKYIPSAIELRTVTLPGRGRRIAEMPIESISDMAEEISRHILSINDGRQILLYGHSMGAALAYECALRLEQSTEQLSHLFIGGFRAPHLQCTAKTIHDLSNEDFIREIASYGATTREVLENKELLEVFLPMLRSDFKAAETYQNVNDKLTSPISAFYGHKDNRVTPEQVKEWSFSTRNHCSFIELNAHHFFHESHAIEIINTISKSIHISKYESLTA